MQPELFTNSRLITMLENIPVEFWWLLGIFLQAAFFVRYKFDLKFGIAIIFAAGTAIYGFFQGTTNIGATIATVALMFSFAFAVLFQKEALPNIGEQNLLSYTIIIVYMILAYVYKPDNTTLSADMILVLFLAAITLPVLFISFFDFKLKPMTKIILYLWFIIISIILILTQVNVWEISKFLQNRSPFEALLGGMVLLYLLVNVMAIIKLIPFPSEDRSIDEALRDCKEHANLLAEKFMDYQLRPFHAALILVFEAGMLASNYYLKIVPDFVVINLWILAAFYVKDFEKIENFVKNFMQLGK